LLGQGLNWGDILVPVYLFLIRILLVSVSTELFPHTKTIHLPVKGKMVKLKRTQFKVFPGYARTLHGTQSESLKQMIASLNFGFHIPNGNYVLLSRPVDRDSIGLLDSFRPSVLQTPPSPALIEEQERLANLARTTAERYFGDIKDLRADQEAADRERSEMVGQYIAQHGARKLVTGKGKKRKERGTIEENLHLAKRHKTQHPAAPASAPPPPVSAPRPNAARATKNDLERLKAGLRRNMERNSANGDQQPRS
jgi:hypothetical protein